MQFLSLLLQNYRVHRHLQVDFSRTLTLIGGPNEAGKSTLVEALHRVLFLRAKGTSEDHRVMRSHAAGAGHPSVTLRFLAQGREWTLQKTFSGQNGSVSLTTAGTPALQGEAADGQLAQLLGVDGTASGKQLPLQWAHLWLWQGTAAEDPTTDDTLPTQRLTPRLQNQGGAANLLTSPLDQRLLSHFEKAAAEYFTANGKTAVNGPLGRAEQALVEARDLHTRATERVQRYERALADHEEAVVRLADLGRTVAQLDAEAARLKARAATLQGLNEQATRETHEAQRFAEEHTRLDRAHQDIAQKHDHHARLAAALAPLSEQTGVLEQQAAGSRAEATRAAAAREGTAVAAARARAIHELLTTASDHRQRGQTLERLQARAAAREQHRVQLENHRSELARQPAIDEKQLKQITKLDTELTRAEATLGSLATGIELLASDTPVTLGDKTLAPGQSCIITADTELHLANGQTCLRIRPGGGTSLSEAQQAVDRAHTALAQALAALAVRDLEAARQANNQRVLLAERLAQVQRELDAPDFAQLDADRATAQEAHDQSEGRLRRLAEALPEVSVPAEAPALAAALERATQDKDVATAQEAADARAAKVAHAHAEQARLDLDAHRQKIAEQEKARSELAAQLSLLRQTHGEDIPRSVRLAEAAAAAQSAATRLAQTRQAIAELQPEQLGRDLARLDRSRENATQEHATQDERRIAALATLRSDGSEDPLRDATESAAALARAEAAHRAVQRDAEATRLVRDRYHQAQQALADRFTRPLVERISAYLACLFGPGAQASLRHAPEGFTDLTLTRAQGAAIPFASLSMGAREQVAAAVRLAAAEFLAQDHDDALPLIFDDAFAYADPERGRALQGMLDLAATRGLQIIVLSCTPADYAALGAKETTLPRPTPPGNAPGILIAPSVPTQAPAEPPAPANDAEPANSELAEQFLDALATAHAAGEPLVSSTALRKTLGCEPDAFAATRDALLVAGQIVVEGRSQRLADGAKP